jgi:F-type H+-transporting ATPase subunit b
MRIVASSGLIKVIPGLMVWTIIAFGITLFVLSKWIFPPVQKAIDARRDRILEALNEADNARDEARKLLEEHRALIGQARGEAERILADAREVSDSQRERVRNEIEEDRQRRLEETNRQIEAETRRALEQIRSEVASLTLIATSRVTGKVLTDEDHRRLIESAVKDLDFSELEADRN